MDAGAQLANLECLDLSDNEIGDPGLISFSEALAKGSLRSLTVLSLRNNQISDPGMIAFSNAIRNGSLASLITFHTQMLND